MTGNTNDREALAERLTGDIFDAVPDDNDMQHVLAMAADALTRQPQPHVVETVDPYSDEVNALANRAKSLIVDKFEGEGPAWWDDTSGDRLAEVAADSLRDLFATVLTPATLHEVTASEPVEEVLNRWSQSDSQAAQMIVAEVRGALLTASEPTEAEVEAAAIAMAEWNGNTDGADRPRGYVYERQARVALRAARESQAKG